MQHKTNKLLLAGLFSTLLLGGCQVVSVKNQALRYNQGKREIQEIEAYPDAAWFYVI